jgi:dTDP-glucose 4,6-dehydratase
LPNSPYSASKAGGDHLVRAYHQTYGLPVITTRCSNNYGPYQNPEKLIPLMIQRLLEHRPIPIYGDGLQTRDWLYVEDHCRALFAALCRGELGASYLIGGHCELRNIDVANKVVQCLRELAPQRLTQAEDGLITHVEDRLGHDRRYAIAPDRIERELGWKPREDFDSGLRRTVEWYLERFGV